MVYKQKGSEDIPLHDPNLHAAICQGEQLHCDAQLGYCGVVVTGIGVESFRKQAYLKWNIKNAKPSG